MRYIKGNTAYLKAVYVFTGILVAYSTVMAGQWRKAAALYPYNQPANCIMTRVATQSKRAIILDYTIPAPRFTRIPHQNLARGPAVRCDLGNARILSQPGKPLLPYIYSRVIIPQGYTVDRIRLIPARTVSLPGIHVLGYGEMPTPASYPKPLRTTPDLTIYNSDAAYPEKTVSLTSISYRCGVTIAHIDIFPLSYSPGSDAISYFPEFSLEIVLKPSLNTGTDLSAYPARLLKGIITEENPEALSTYTSVKPASGQTYTWLAITSQDIIDATTTPNINDLVDLRTSQGFTCRVAAIEDVLRDTQGAEDKDKLRNYIRDAYQNWETEFVLLGGDINIIPLETVRCPINQDFEDIPSDLPYQCLDQTSWDDDFEAEVFIGRISAEDVTEFANHVYKIIAYETDPDTARYLISGLNFGEKLDDQTFGSVALEDLEKVFPAPFTFDDFYESPSVSFSKSEVIEKINSDDYSIWSHVGHASQRYGLKLNNDDEERLTNTKFIFLKSEACLWGAIDVDCFAERITSSTRTGLYALIANARYGFYTQDLLNVSSYKVHKSLWLACFEENMDYLGEFNEYSHRMNQRERWDIVESNLLGDPAIKFRGKQLPPYVRVIAPNGGEQWEREGTVEIRWEDNLSEDVIIELINGTAVQSVVASAVPSSGVFQWTISSDLPLGDDYTIRITSSTTDTVSDVSNAPFSIIAGTGIAANDAMLRSSLDLWARGSKIHFSIPSGAENRLVSIGLYTMKGREIQILVKGVYTAGYHYVDLHAGAGNGIAPGMYMCTITADNVTRTTRILLTQ